jgi:hypothetical protein
LYFLQDSPPHVSGCARGGAALTQASSLISHFGLPAVQRFEQKALPSLGTIQQNRHL